MKQQFLVTHRYTILHTTKKKTWHILNSPTFKHVTFFYENIRKYSNNYTMHGPLNTKILGKAYFMDTFWPSGNVGISLNLLTPTHAQLYFIKDQFKKLLHVSVYDHLQGVTKSSLKSQLFKHSCVYTTCGGVAAYHVACIGLCLWSVRVCVLGKNM